MFLPVNYRLAAPEAAYILGDAGAKLLLVDEEFDAIVALETPKIVIDAHAQADSRRLGQPGLEIPPQAAVAETDLVRLMYTSGTTSRPKGVMHSVRQPPLEIHRPCDRARLTASEKLLVVGPLYHVGAFDLPGIAVLWVGGTLSCTASSDPEAVLASIERHRLTCGLDGAGHAQPGADSAGSGPLRPGYLRLVHRRRREDAGSRIRDFTRRCSRAAASSTGSA